MGFPAVKHDRGGGERFFSLSLSLFLFSFFLLFSLFFQNLNLLLPPFTLEGDRPFPVTHPSLPPESPPVMRATPESVITSRRNEK